MACRGDEWALLSRGIINRRGRRAAQALHSITPALSHAPESPPARLWSLASSWQLESQLPSERALNSASVIWAWLFMLSRAGPSSPAEPQDSRSEIKSFVSVASWLRGLEASGAAQKELGSAWQAMVLGTLSDSLFSASPGQLGIPARSNGPQSQGRRRPRFTPVSLLCFFQHLRQVQNPLCKLLQETRAKELRSSRKKHLSLWASLKMQIPTAKTNPNNS